ncbi:methyltransferase domain-containing protein [Myxozyma melibiosi]|uniref:Methyltransferase domain-containing protein n=1 Tax=Myxozyma melibiosi TaxID=54550 RepID=A0ABR1F9B7_9ASCO
MDGGREFPIPDGFEGGVDQYLVSLVGLYLEPLVQDLVGKVQILDFFLGERDLLQETVSEEWLQFFDDGDLDQILDFLIFFKNPESLHPPSSLVDFISKIRHLSIDRTLPKDLASTAPLPFLQTSALSLGMSPKKIHECQYLAAAVSSICDDVDTRHVIDLGSGKGYLSRTLAHEFDCSVVAVESVKSRTEGAGRLDTLYDSKGGKRKAKALDAYRAKGSLIHVEKFVSSGDLHEVVDQAELLDEKAVLVGLHTCGNLSHHALRSLFETKAIHGVAVVGCCYNQMTEKLADHDDIGFPMSSKLDTYNIPLPMSARMLACQAPATWTKSSREDFFKRHFYRALLQRIFKDRNLLESDKDKIVIGSLRKQWYTSFSTYCTGACRRAASAHSYRIRSSSPADSQNPFEITPEVAEHYHDLYLLKKRRLSILWTLMACTVAPLTEALIHLDRFYFLKENGARKVSVSVVFNQSISARNLLVVGLK